jgi:hypothetical protein
MSPIGRNSPASVVGPDWALSPKPAEGFLAVVKAHNRDMSGKAIVVQFADALPVTVVLPRSAALTKPAAALLPTSRNP